MTTPQIYLAFTDDWELRGDGSGDIDAIQFQPMKRLLEIFDKHNMRSTFMVEVMQQLTFRREQERTAQLKPLADAWDDHVRDAFKRGHDIQLHIHPQWSKPKFEDGEWRLSGDWSLPNYEPDAAAEMISAGKRYLEELLQPIDPGYSCVAFRSGSSVIAPSPFMLNLLVEQGIVFDLSIVGGLRVNTKNVQFDYTSCEEDFLPFYPKMSDARQLSDKAEPIICVPIFHFTGSRRRVTLQVVSKIWNKVKAKSKKALTSDPTKNDWVEIGRSSLAARSYDKAISPVLFGKHLTADTGQLDFPLLCEMIRAIRSKAKASGLSAVPVILTNHSKYMNDFSGFDRFLSQVSSAGDISMITLTELARKLRAEEFYVKKQASD